MEPLLKLDLACGQHPREGYTGVDLCADEAPIKLDLLKFPWPWDDASVDALHCSHFLEHIPMVEIEGQDALFRFMDETWRILKPQGEFTIVYTLERTL